MINYISSWAEQIIIAVIIVTILEMILPNGNSKKYIKTILGVYILYTIISPAIKLITGSDLKINYSEYEKYFNTKEVSSNIETMSIEDRYKKEIEKQIKLDLEKIGFEATKVSTDFDLNEGIIKKITIYASKKEEKKETNITINKIQVGDTQKENNLNTNEIEKIKQKLNEDYGVDYKNIIVNSK